MRSAPIIKQYRDWQFWLYHPHRTRLCQKDTAGRTDLRGDPKPSRRGGSPRARHVIGRPSNGVGFLHVRDLSITNVTALRRSDIEAQRRLARRPPASHRDCRVGCLHRKRLSGPGRKYWRRISSDPCQRGSGCGESFLEVSRTEGDSSRAGVLACYHRALVCRSHSRSARRLATGAAGNPSRHLDRRRLLFWPPADASRTTLEAPPDCAFRHFHPALAPRGRSTKLPRLAPRNHPGAARGIRGHRSGV
jgi:hypothetical protein